MIDRRWGRNFILAWLSLCAFAVVRAHGQNNAEAERSAARRAARVASSATT